MKIVGSEAITVPPTSMSYTTDRILPTPLLETGRMSTVDPPRSNLPRCGGCDQHECVCRKPSHADTESPGPTQAVMIGWKVLERRTFADTVHLGNRVGETGVVRVMEDERRARRVARSKRPGRTMGRQATIASCREAAIRLGEERVEGVMRRQVWHRAAERIAEVEHERQNKEVGRSKQS
jgi:hypothetical protein